MGKCFVNILNENFFSKNILHDHLWSSIELDASMWDYPDICGQILTEKNKIVGQEISEFPISNFHTKLIL